jgi:hypothetical protein
MGTWGFEAWDNDTAADKLLASRYLQEEVPKFVEGTPAFWTPACNPNDGCQFIHSPSSVR